MIVLSDKKVNHLRELICLFYDLENEAERADWSSTIVGMLDYIIDTESMSKDEASPEDFM